jgi:HK97 gp10 family phage protein
MRAKVIRKKKAEWPKKFRRVQERFLPQAGLIVEGQAKLNAPVDSGNLRSSITTEVKDEEVIVGTNVEYAPYVEYGTKRMRAQPYLRPALDKNRKDLVRLFRDELRDVFRGR